MKKESLAQQLLEVHTQADLSRFVGALHDDLLGNSGAWENSDLASFLEAMSAWIEDMDGYFLNQGQHFDETVSWNSVALILLAARSYE